MNIEFFSPSDRFSLRQLWDFGIGIEIKGGGYRQWVSTSKKMEDDWENDVRIHKISKNFYGEFYNSEDSHNGGNCWSAQVNIIDSMEFREGVETRLLINSCFGTFVDEGGPVPIFVPPQQMVILTTRSKNLKFYYLLNGKIVDPIYFLYKLNESIVST